MGYSKTILCFALCAVGFGLCVLLLINPALGNEVEEFVYDDQGKRDPFRPLITHEGTFGDGAEGVESIDDIRLEGIVWDPAGGSFAIINGEIMKENEQVNNIRVTKISPNAIIISIDNKEYTINLVEEEGE